MRARDIVGRKILAVRQYRYWNGYWVIGLEEIELEGDVLLRFSVAEEVHGGEYMIQGIASKPSHRRKSEGKE